MKKLTDTKEKEIKEIFLVNNLFVKDQINDSHQVFVKSGGCIETMVISLCRILKSTPKQTAWRL